MKNSRANIRSSIRRKVTLGPTELPVRGSERSAPAQCFPPEIFHLLNQPRGDIPVGQGVSSLQQLIDEHEQSLDTRRPPVSHATCSRADTHFRRRQRRSLRQVPINSVPIVGGRRIDGDGALVVGRGSLADTDVQLIMHGWIEKWTLTDNMTAI